MTSDTPTEIICILDRSGSMSAIRDDAIGGFNTFLEDQKEAGGTALLTLVLFDDVVDIVHEARAIEEVPHLDGDTFVPRGTTALYDAIGKTLEAATRRNRSAARADQRVIVCILTDGEENASRRFNRREIFDRIRRLREQRGWEFVYLAANQDVFAVADRLCISRDRSLAFQATGAGIRGAYQALTLLTNGSRRGSFSSSGGGGGRLH